MPNRPFRDFIPDETQRTAAACLRNPSGRDEVSAKQMRRQRDLPAEVFADYPKGQPHSPFRIAFLIRLFRIRGLMGISNVTRETRLSLLEELQSDTSDDAWVRFSGIYDGLIRVWLNQAGLQSADADDVRQDVMQFVFSRIRRFEHNGRRGAFRCWLRRIVGNRVSRLWEKKSSRERVEAGLDLQQLAGQLTDDNSRLSITWDNRHDDYVLDKLLESLSDRFSQQSLVVFRRVGVAGEDARRVATELGMSLGAVRVAQHRVLKALKSRAATLVD